MNIDEIYLGDAYELIKRIPDKSIDLIVTDPPYKIESLTGGGMIKQKGIDNPMKELGEKGLNLGINLSILDEFMRIMKKPNIYIWMNLKQLYEYLDYFVGKKDCEWNLIVWQKSNAMPLCGGKYLNDCEYCAYFHKGVRLNTKYDTAKTVYVTSINQADKDKYGHPTIKPLEIIENLIKNSSRGGGVIFDPFLGSGTTAVAAKELGRHYIGFEIDPTYFKIAQDRIAGIDKRGQTSLEIHYQQENLF